MKTKSSLIKILILFFIGFVLLVFLVESAIFLNAYLNSKSSTDTPMQPDSICTTEDSISTESISDATEYITHHSSSFYQYVTEDNPLTLVFPDEEYLVGNCSFSLDKLEMVYQIYKSNPGSGTSYIKHIRIHVTVQNRSAQQTTFSMKKPGTWIIGTYYSGEEKIDIGVNNNYTWKVESEIVSSSECTLAPYQSASICVTGIYINEDQLEYSDLPRIDLFFVNNQEIITLSLNQ